MLSAFRQGTDAYLDYRLIKAGSFTGFDEDLAERWTIKHSFYVAVGGLRISNTSYLTMEGVIFGITEKVVDVDTIPSQRAIADKSKADITVKMITIVQVRWLLVQCIARAISKLPVTTLEITVLAYIPCMLFITAFWWEKPYNVNEPTLLTIDRPNMRNEDDRICRYGRLPTFINCSLEGALEIFEGNLSGIFVLAAACFVFGGIHCTAWNFAFNSAAERWLWRISSVILCSVIPVLSMAMKATEQIMGMVHWFIVVWIGGPVLVLYVAARLYLLVECFVGLRSLPSECYSTVVWTSFISHV
ncbi:hypothetical protein K402DRAFT_464374 [Aulographum hederae CBS 113979]|uniref:Uncharacterized protein n=1 Tax=Aulographum hederae CBS 113979 TaxID=1176131 RepID=A0A6G1GWQ8_9PEZI|nr:hypothetical protein K402DRAFT_464374 [Aulographum hederae CBS 113979]